MSSVSIVWSEWTDLVPFINEIKKIQCVWKIPPYTEDCFYQFKADNDKFGKDNCCTFAKFKYCIRTTLKQACPEVHLDHDFFVRIESVVNFIRGCTDEYSSDKCNQLFGSGHTTWFYAGFSILALIILILLAIIIFYAVKFRIRRQARTPKNTRSAEVPKSGMIRNNLSIKNCNVRKI